MGKDSAKTLTVFGIMASAVIVGAMIYTGFGYISVLYLILLTYILGHALIGGAYELFKLKSEKSNDEIPKKEREAAMIMAWIPGLGQAYMGDFKKGIIPLSIFILAIACIIIDLGIGTEMFLFIYGLILYFYSAVWSSIDINEMCNKLDLEHTGSPFEMKWENNSQLRDILSIIAYIVIVLITYTFMMYEGQDRYISMSIILLSTILLVDVLVRHLHGSKQPLIRT